MCACGSRVACAGFRTPNVLGCACSQTSVSHHLGTRAHDGVVVVPPRVPAAGLLFVVREHAHAPVVAAQIGGHNFDSVQNMWLVSVLPQASWDSQENPQHCNCYMYSIHRKLCCAASQQTPLQVGYVWPHLVFSGHDSTL